MGDDDKYINEKLFENISNRFSFQSDYVYGDTIYENEGKKTRYYKSYSLMETL